MSLIPSGVRATTYNVALETHATFTMVGVVYNVDHWALQNVMPYIIRVRYWLLQTRSSGVSTLGFITIIVILI